MSIIVAPVAGFSAVYSFFAVICHQDASRSWHILGEPLPVCIRCASIYFGFLASLWVGLSARIQWLRVATILVIFEFTVAHLFADLALARSVSGIFFGLAAAPFVRLGIEELNR
jgi:uncharacterized membrane protein